MYSEIERYQLIQARKKLICHVIVFVQRFVQVFDQMESTWRLKIKKQTPQLNLR